jgi:NAD(P)-dependent dehydrogenase (short-subunit alcohol dehydrogenase family)
VQSDSPTGTGSLAGRVALVSGVARAHGVGRATALRLVAAGASVMCADIVTEQKADTGTATPARFGAVMEEIRAAAAAHGVRAASVSQTDFDAPAWASIVAATTTEYGRIDICCSLNGVTGATAGDGLILDISPEAWQRSLDLNLTSAFLLLQAAARAMIAGGRPGSLTQLSTAAAITAKESNGAVGSARSAVNFLVAVLARELGPHGIRCNAVAPLAIAPTGTQPNPGLVLLAEREGGSLEEWARRRIPLGRMQDPDETARVIEFLCSDAASYVSGTVVPTVGGANF